MDRVKDAITEANGWVKLAEPILRELSKLEEIKDNLERASSEARGGLRSTVLSRAYDSAIRPIEQARVTLSEVAEDFRENAICDVNFYTDRDATEEVEDQNERDNDTVRNTVTSFEDAVEQIKLLGENQ